MFYKKTGLPEEGDYVLCTVKKILFHSVFVVLDEYEHKEGMIHISEISPGRIRNIRDYVKEGKKLICKVLRVNKERHQVDLSLRRVSTALRKKKNEDMKQELKAEKILEFLAKKTKTDIKQIYKDFAKEIIDDYGSIFEFFQDVVIEEAKLTDYEIPKEYLKELEEIIKDKIKPPTVQIEAEMIITCEKEDGVEIIKKLLIDIIQYAEEKEYQIELLYVSAPKYRIIITAGDYKTAEKILETLGAKLKKDVESSCGTFEINKK